MAHTLLSSSLTHSVRCGRCVAGTASRTSSVPQQPPNNTICLLSSQMGGAGGQLAGGQVDHTVAGQPADAPIPIHKSRSYIR